MEYNIATVNQAEPSILCRKRNTIPTRARRSSSFNRCMYDRVSFVQGLAYFFTLTIDNKIEGKRPIELVSLLCVCACGWEEKSREKLENYASAAASGVVQQRLAKENETDQARNLKSENHRSRFGLFCLSVRKTWEEKHPTARTSAFIRLSYNCFAAQVQRNKRKINKSAP